MTAELAPFNIGSNTIGVFDDTRTISGYLMTDIDRREWVQYFEMLYANPSDPYHDDLLTDKLPWLVGGIDCQTTIIDQTTGSHCRYNWQ